MRSLILIQVNNREYLAGNPPPAALQEAMGKLMGEWSSAGTLLSAEGLQAPSKGAKLRLGGGKLTVSDGPFTEAKEVIGGFFLVKTETLDEAVAMTRDFLELHREVLGPDFEIGCEVRPVDE